MSPWYQVSLTILSINSVINPMLYSKLLQNALTFCKIRFQKALEQETPATPEQEHEQDDPEHATPATPEREPEQDDP